MGAPSFFLGLALLVSVPFAACLGPDIDPVSAPDGPDSLLVGSHRFEQHHVRASRSWGHTLTVSFQSSYSGDSGESPFTTEVVALSGKTARFEEWLSEKRPAHDAFGRPIDVVLRQSRNLAANDTPRDQPPPEAPRVAIDVGTGALVFRERMEHASDTRNGVKQEWSRDVRTYFRDGDYAVSYPGPLAGRVLHLGERIEVVRDYASSSIEWRSFTNYTVLRQEYVGGERTFVLRVEGATIPVYIPEGTKLANLTDPLAPGEKPPPSTSLLWVSHESPFIVKSEFREPFKANGKWYWTNVSWWRESYEAKGPPIPFGAAKDPVPKRREGEAPRVAPPNYLAQTQSKPLTYPVADAWKAIEEDPTLIDYKRFRMDHPNAWPTSAYYVPDPANRTFTWTFGVQDARGFPVVVSSRLMRTTPMQLEVVTNRMEDWRRLWFDFPARQSAYPSMDPMMSISDALKASAAYRPAGLEPGVFFGPRIDMFRWETWAGIDIVAPEDLRRGNAQGFSYLIPTWSVTFDAYDGGLKTLNWTIAHALPSQPRSIPVTVQAEGSEASMADGFVRGPGGVIWAVRPQS